MILKSETTQVESARHVKVSGGKNYEDFKGFVQRDSAAGNFNERRRRGAGGNHHPAGVHSNSTQV
jgi:hypothetical protein